MTRILLAAASLLLTFVTVSGQDYSRKEADSMRNSIKKGKPGIDRVYLLLHLAEFYILKPGEEKVDFDSAQTYLNEAALLNKSIGSVDAGNYMTLTEARLIGEKGQKEEAKKKIEEMISKLESGANKTHLEKAYYDLSSYYNYWDSYDKKIGLVEKSVNIYKHEAASEDKAVAVKMLGNLYALNGEYPKAIEYLKSAEAVYDSIHSGGVYGVYVLFAQIYKFLGDYKPALTYGLMALKKAEEINDTTMQMCQIYNAVGGIYQEVGRTDQSVKYFKYSLEVAVRYHDTLYTCFMILTTTNAYCNGGRPKDALEFLNSLPKKYLAYNNDEEGTYIDLAYFTSYVLDKQYNNAKPYLNRLLELAPHGNFLVQDNIYRTAAQYYVETGQFANASICLVKNENNLKKLESPRKLASTEKLWYKVDSAEGNFQSAFKHLLAHKTMNDSVFTMSKARELQILEVEYETDKKDQNIKLLTNQSLLDQANIRENRFAKNAMIAGSALLLLLLIMVYSRYVLKQKSNRQLQRQQQQINEQNISLQNLVTEQNKLIGEKEWLLKEIHHRVKNNLQIVMSLLNSQSAYIDNVPALTAIQDSQHRVHAMSLIHQKLYNADNVSSIDMSFYIRELVSYLADSYNTGQRIRFDLDIEPIEMDVSQAVPLGLILNEAITNAIKYAFPGDRSGMIAISLASTPSDQYLLTIADNGIGMPVQFNDQKPGSLGMSLMKGLSEDIDGNFTIENNNGTTIKIAFAQDMDILTSGALTESLISQN